MLSGNQNCSPDETVANGLPETLKMKPTYMAILALCLCLAGCGKREQQDEQAKIPPVDPSKHKRFIWAFETGDGVYSSPAVGADGTVYVGSSDGKLYALNGKTGAKIWEVKTGLRTDSPAIGVDGTVYIPFPFAVESKLYALDGKTGAKKWEFETGGSMISSPVIGADGTLYIGSRDKKIYAIKTDSKGPANSPWPMRGQNAQHTGRAPKK